MLFNSLPFIVVFLPISLFGFFYLARFGQVFALAWLTLASLVFYGWDDPGRLIPIILGSAVFNFIVARALLHRCAVWLLALGIVGDLLYLGYFKYVDFFAHTITWLTGIELPPSNITLPIGISFFTFTQIAFLVDSYRRSAREYHPVNYGLFVTFFPHLIAGPIIHHAEIMPQFEQKKTFTFDPAATQIALLWFVAGLFKKVMIADSIAPVVATVFDTSKSVNAIKFLDGWIGATGYGLQLYFDFSGYSDMAIGLALMFGIAFPLNFNSPYKAHSIIDFWRRWNMTLSRFLRDYLYIPLGGNRNGPIRRYVNIMVTMLLGGLWHGASWNFVIWGALHGAALVANHHFDVERSARDRPIASLCGTLAFVMIAWVPFRAENLHSVLVMWQAMFGLSGFSPRSLFAVTQPLALAAAGAALGAALFLPNTAEIIENLDSHILPRMAAGAGLLFGMIVGAIALHAPTEFLYFRF
jgi:alginate O-acetyltransferase complex protein AlgI